VRFPPPRRTPPRRCGRFRRGLSACTTPFAIRPSRPASLRTALPVACNSARKAAKLSRSLLHLLRGWQLQRRPMPVISRLQKPRRRSSRWSESPRRHAPASARHRFARVADETVVLRRCIISTVSKRPPLRRPNGGSAWSALLASFANVDMKGLRQAAWKL
jgi:hypothetical protein